MGSLFRSREMTLCQLFLQSDSAYACVRELGELGMVHFCDLNPDVSAFQRKFVNEVRRCDEMERKLRFLSNELERVGLQPTPVGFVDAPDPQDMIDLESRFEELESEVKEINTNTETLKRNMLDLVELRHIIQKAHGFFEAAESFTYQGTGATTTEEAKGSGLLDEEAPAVAASDQTRLTFVAGVIRRERLQRFEQVLWRACRGNVFVQQSEIEDPLEDPATGDPVYKNVFVLFFQGDQLRMRVKKICEGFRATLYECPPTSAKRREMAMAVSGRIDDLATVLQQTQDHSVTQLEAIAGQIETWKQKVVKIKSIFHTMNKFNLDVTARCLIAESWCPVEDLEAIQLALMRGTERSGSSVPSILHRITAHEPPPTYNKTNKFTKGFQAIVDAYGVATYQEVNPAPYAMITFPFLFAVMFGDAGHGFLMALFALFMILREKQLSKSKAGGDMFQIIFKGRYIVFLMGLFSIYTGLIYNDMFSKSVNIFGSSWNASYQGLMQGQKLTFVEQVESEGKTATLLPTSAFESANPYPFGIDPIWQVSTNKLRFVNSYKMKLALILGISQMTFGVVLSLFNHIHFKRYINIVADFIPQLLFLMSLFGYLVVLILTKWLRPWPRPAGAPSILITMINMFLKFGSSPEEYSDDNPDTNPLFGDHAEPQLAIQSMLVVLAILCVPWMLILKPLYVYIRNKRRKKRDYTVAPSRDMGDGSDDEAALVPGDESEKKKSGDSGGGGGGHGDHDSDSIGEVIVLQSIHTIEFCLGCLSHTASYLRLWALSLAHAELSEVLWQQILNFGYVGYMRTLSIPGAWLNTILQIILVFGGFAAWAVGTIGVLLVMEGLSAFLHTLRLHWIEFQTKFYVGEGYKFRPFSFADILAGEGDD